MKKNPSLITITPPPPQRAKPRSPITIALSVALFPVWFPFWAYGVFLAAQFDRTRDFSKWLYGRYECYRYGGFTLIELSIVLVIIGLIVGGVLTGRDLIGAAAVRAEITQVEKFNAAANTFYGKYQALPGDLSLTAATQFGFVTTGCTGGVSARDGNGIIDSGGNNTEADTSVIAYGEPALFWSDLSQIGLVEGNFSTATCNGANPSLAQTGLYLPSAKIGNGNYIYVYAYTQKNFFGLSQVMGWSGWEYSGPGLTVSQAASIDKKTDDGLPTSGKVQANYASGTYNGSHCTIGGGSVIFANDTCTSASTTVAGGTSASCYDTTTNTYSLTQNNGNGVNCALSFQLQAGD